MSSRYGLDDRLADLESRADQLHRQLRDAVTADETDEAARLTDQFGAVLDELGEVAHSLAQKGSR